jgi:hypothetical protein
MLADVFWNTMSPLDLPDEFWDLFPERGNVSRKRVARIAERVREIFKPRHVSESSYDFWSWVGEQATSLKSEAKRRRDEAADKYAEALRETFLLDPTYGDAGRVLHDAERRLDRQVTQALADLEAARKLRP